MGVHSIDAEDDQFAYRYDTQLLIERRDQDLDEDEALDVLEYPFEEAYQMAARGEMIDAKTIAALMMAKEQLGEELLP